MMKTPLLYLCHRIPYPPNKGDKIRSYHLLKHLCLDHEVYLGGFIDDPIDWEYAAKLNEICKETCFISLDPTRARIKSLTGLFSRNPLTLPYYYDKKLEKWVNQIIARHSIKKCIVYSSAMAQYVMQQKNQCKEKIIDFVDIDSDKWRQYSEKKSWPMNWIYTREANFLHEFEKKISREFDRSFFVSKTEAEIFQTMVPDIASKVDFYNNGVDTDFFTPDSDLDNPYPASSKVLVFTGAMDYWPNIDAVVWFSETILPQIIRTDPDVKFYIVGGNPSQSVIKLGEYENIIVTGRVDDIRPYLKYAKVAIAPMRIARGIQNKVLEAMAMARPVITSPQGFEGICARPGKELYVVNDQNDWIDNIRKILLGSYEDIGKAARDRVLVDYSWEGSLVRFDQDIAIGGELK